MVLSILAYIYNNKPKGDGNEKQTLFIVKIVLCAFYFVLLSLELFGWFAKSTTLYFVGLIGCIAVWLVEFIFIVMLKLKKHFIARRVILIIVLEGLLLLYSNVLIFSSFNVTIS